MSYLTVFIQELAAIFLFFYSIERFSKIILHDNLEKLKYFFTKVSDTNTKGMILGLISTAFLQSSTAVSTLTVALTNAGIFKISTAMPIIFGSSIGTSSTAFIASIKIQSAEQLLIIIGAILGFTKRKTFGKTIFYLGLLLFSIEQMSVATSSLKDTEACKYLFTQIDNIFLLFIIGVFITIVFQSSSLVTSMLVVLISHGGIEMRNAMIICIGSFVGTTLTSLIVSLKLSKNARTVGILNAVISLKSGIINLFFVDIFINFALYFKNIGIGLAFGNSLSRVFSAFICLGLFILWKRYFQKKNI